jgi:hypothetical protein
MGSLTSNMSIMSIASRVGSSVSSIPPATAVLRAASASPIL